jgi:transcriptional regulator GlxA family with amidase domain
VLYTTDDRVMTSAGIVSGIDLSLHLLAVRHGPAFASRVARDMLTRLFGPATGGLTPLRYQQLLRLERAEHLIDHGTTVEAAAREVGFEDARMLRRLRARAS